MANRGSIWAPGGGRNPNHPFWLRYEGPFFERDPARQVAINLRDFVQEAGEHAEKVAKAAAPVGRTASGFGYGPSGRLRDSINLRTYGRKPWQATVVISTFGLGRGRWPGTRSPARYGSTWFNYAGKVEARRHFMRKGRRALSDVRRANRKLLRGLT